MKDNISTNRLGLNAISHNYGEIEVLKNISIEAKPFEFVVIVGPSGCGKTTLLNILSGHIKPVSGTVVREGIIRTVYQQDGLFPWLTVSENICMGLRSVNDKQEQENNLRELIDLIHLDGFENHYPYQLSGGMRQRVELARVLAGDSDILLMDEPFSSLDYQARLRMRNELVRVLAKRPRTVVFVTHDIEEAAQLADRVLVLSPRPSSVCRQLQILAPRPRNLTDAVVVDTMKKILNELGLNSTSTIDS